TTTSSRHIERTLLTLAGRLRGSLMAQPNRACLTSTPKKSASTIETRIIAVRRLLARCSLRSVIGIARVVMSRRDGLDQRTVGGVSKVWCGAGLGTVHSRPCGVSQTSAVAGWPLPRTHLYTQYTNRSCDSPKPNEPIEDSMLKSANCSA